MCGGLARVDGRAADVAAQRSTRGLDGGREGGEANAQADADASSELLVGEDEVTRGGVVQESEAAVAHAEKAGAGSQ